MGSSQSRRDGRNRRAAEKAARLRNEAEKRLMASNAPSERPASTPAGHRCQCSEPSVVPKIEGRRARFLRLPHAMRRWLHQSWKIVDIFAVGLSLLGIGYLVYDFYYQTKIAVDFAYSDAKTALDNPIALKNISNLFTIENITVTCTILHSLFERNTSVSDTNLYSPKYISSIAPGSVVNIVCNRADAGPGIKVDNANLIEAAVVLSVEYDAKLFFISFHRRPDPFFFRWVGNISQPQWIRGRDIQ